MSERWQALMAMSASNTQKTKSEVEMALAQRREKEAQLRKIQAEKEKKEQEMERMMRLRHFENMQKEQERKRKEEEIKKAKEAAMERRLEEERLTALYGPKKAKAKMGGGKDSNGVEWPKSSSQDKKKSEARQRTTDEYEEPTGFEFLTREEKRQRKQALEMQKLVGGPKKSSSNSRYTKIGNKLRGGAVDMMAPAGGSATAGDSSKSVRQRLASMPNTLMKLNTVKRDTRTIDEILQDRQKDKEKKTLDGDEAKGFDDWFGTRKDKLKKSSAPTTTAPSVVTSGANTPSSQRSTPQPSTLREVKKATIPPRHSSAQPRLPPTKATSNGPKASSSLGKPKGSFQPLPSSYKSGKASTATSVPKKRPRSPTPETDFFSDEDDYDDHRPTKRRGAEDTVSGHDIWAIMGLNKKKYTALDYNSDDEDMEADALAVEREEKFSAKLAKKEDQEALEAEKRHEAEKRRRKKERERQMARA